ncbi:MAG TPA: hypothetical protein VFS24_08665 [Steroidobacteraceae bacterium]|nr:hypothetical protein [Steroidobacteraceae bacterium]
MNIQVQSMIVALSIAASSAYASDFRDREFARTQLTQTQSAEASLRKSSVADQALRDRLDRLVSRWSHHESASARFPACKSATQILSRYAPKVHSADRDWLTDQRRKYSAAVTRCRLDLNRS